MVNSTDGIGRLIAEEVLLQSERQLLRNRDQPPQERKGQPEPQPSSPPLTHNDKAVSSVLLTLLDEQLDASALGSNRHAGESATAEFGNGTMVPSPSKIGAQYTEAETAFHPDNSVGETPIPLLQPNAQTMASSPELRMMMESAFVTAAARLRAGVNNTPGAAANKKSKVSADLAPLVRIGGGILAATIIVLIIAVVIGR